MNSRKKQRASRSGPHTGGRRTRQDTVERISAGGVDHGHGAPAERRSPPGRAEWLLALLIFAGGVLARGNRVELATVEHFDEGVYASNLWFGEEANYQYPLRHLYAPPLLPALIEWSMILSGQATGFMAIVPSLVAGCATTLVLWWCARSWFGTPAAAAAACLAAFNDVHVYFSRTALTDCLLLLFFSQSVFLFERAWRRRAATDFASAGAAAGLGWWTKYNGWLPLAVSGIGLALAGLSAAVPRSVALRLARGWIIACLTALLVWLPVLYLLQPSGGYAAVAANHSRFVVGLAGWLGSAGRQIANLQALDGAGSSLAWYLAILMAWVAGCATRRQENATVSLPAWRECAAVAVLSGMAALLAGWLGGGVLCLVLGAAGLVGRWLRQRVDQPASSLPAGYWLLAAWFSLLTALTPLYTPYLRLTLPLLGATWLASGLLAEDALRLIRRLTVAPQPRPPRPLSWTLRTSAVTVASLGSLAVCAWLADVPQPISWRDDRRGLQRVAGEIRAAIAAGTTVDRGGSPRQSVVYVYGEPALLFHLRAEGVDNVLPVETVELREAQVGGQSLPTYLACGLHALRDPQFHAEFASAQQGFELVSLFAYRPSLLVQLDQQDPRAGGGDSQRAEVRLYRVRR